MLVSALEKGVDDAQTGNGMESGHARNQRQFEAQRGFGRQFAEMTIGDARPHQSGGARVGDDHAW